MSSTSWLEEDLEALQLNAGHRDRLVVQEGGGTSPAQFQAMQKQLEHQAGNEKSGMHAYRIPRAVRAYMCASFGRHTQDSEFSESSLSRVLPAVLVRCLLLWLLRCFELRCLCL